MRRVWAVAVRAIIGELVPFSTGLATCSSAGRLVAIVAACACALLGLAGVPAMMSMWRRKAAAKVRGWNRVRRPSQRIGEAPGARSFCSRFDRLAEAICFKLCAHANHSSGLISRALVALF